MDKETGDLIQEVVDLLSDTQVEVKALREVLIDKKLTSDDELKLRMEAIVHQRYHDLKAEAVRRLKEHLKADRLHQWSQLLYEALTTVSSSFVQARERNPSGPPIFGALPQQSWPNFEHDSGPARGSDARHGGHHHPHRHPSR